MGVGEPALVAAADYASPRVFLDMLERTLGTPPRADWKSRFVRFASLNWARYSDPRCRIIAQFNFEDTAEADSFRSWLYGWKHASSKTPGFGSDPTVGLLDLWNPFGAPSMVFRSRSDAHALIGAPQRPEPYAGSGVNVAIVDLGLDAAWIHDLQVRLGQAGPPPVWGWSRYRTRYGSSGNYLGRDYFNPGELNRLPAAERFTHGHMIARNVLSIAPAARIWDVPLIPNPFEPPHLATAQTILWRIVRAIRTGTFLRWDGTAMVEEALPPGPWVIVNAWGVLNTSQKVYRDYAQDPDHYLVDDMPNLAAKADFVFAAGNCGAPGSDSRCGEGDCGPGLSISGLNAHPDVLTVGAVRTDGMPIAFSAQGPGRLAALGSKGKFDYRNRPEARQKPDVCAPSHFCEDDDDAFLNLGTSAAAGIAAGAVARLRGEELAMNRPAMPPAALRQLLRDRADPGSGGTWDPRLGWGVINLPKASAAVRQWTPSAAVEP
jgi:hypothetical protein